MQFLREATQALSQCDFMADAMSEASEMSAYSGRSERGDARVLQLRAAGAGASADGRAPGKNAVRMPAAELASLADGAGPSAAAEAFLKNTIYNRVGLSRYQPTRVQLLAAPEREDGPSTPSWSALVVDGKTVSYEQVTGVKTQESALEFIVEHEAQIEGLADGSSIRLRMYSRSEFDRWREALAPKITTYPDIQTCAHIPNEQSRALGSKESAAPAGKQVRDALSTLDRERGRPPRTPSAETETAIGKAQCLPEVM